MSTNSHLCAFKLSDIATRGILFLSVFCASFIGCGPAESVYHDGNFSEEQKKAAQAEYQNVEDEESQGSNKKKKKSVKK